MADFPPARPPHVATKPTPHRGNRNMKKSLLKKRKPIEPKKRARHVLVPIVKGEPT